MSTIKSSDEHLTLNADGSGNDIKFQSNGSEVASISDAGKITATNFAANADDLEIQSSTGEKMIKCVKDAQVNLYYDNSVKLATSSTGVTVTGGVALGGTATANILDDYEEGTWTPTFTCSGGGSYTLDSGANTMAYTKIGRIVHIQGGINIDGESSPNGYLRISLPFTPMTGTDDSDYCEGSASLYNHGGNKPNGIKIFVYGDTHAYFRTIPDNGVGFYLDHGDVDTSFQIRTSFTYIAA